MNFLNIRIIIIAIFIFSFQFTFSQYFDLIYKAEEDIINSRYDSVIKTYCQLQENGLRLRSNDCYNLTLAYLFMNNKNAVFNYLDSCILKGFTLEYFNNDVFKPIHHDIRWRKFQEHYDSLRTKYLTHFQDTNYIVIEKMVTLDQTISKNKNMEADSIYYYHGIQLCKMINCHQIIEFELFNFDQPDLRNSIPFILVRHYFGTINRARSINNRNNFYENIIADSCFYKAILQMIHKGKFSPYVFRFGLEYSNTDELFGNNDIFIYSSLSSENTNFPPSELENIKVLAEVMFRNPCDSNDFAKFDKNRKSIGLPTFNHENMIVLYLDSINHKMGEKSKYHFQFLFKPHIQQFYFGSKQIAITNDSAFIRVIFFNSKGIPIKENKIQKNNVLKFSSFE